MPLALESEREVTAEMRPLRPRFSRAAQLQRTLSPRPSPSRAALMDDCSCTGDAPTRDQTASDGDLPDSSNSSANGTCIATTQWRTFRPCPSRATLACNHEDGTFVWGPAICGLTAESDDDDSLSVTRSSSCGSMRDSLDGSSLGSDSDNCNSASDDDDDDSLCLGASGSAGSDTGAILSPIYDVESALDHTWLPKGAVASCPSSPPVSSSPVAPAGAWSPAARRHAYPAASAAPSPPLACIPLPPFAVRPRITQTATPSCGTGPAATVGDILITAMALQDVKRTAMVPEEVEEEVPSWLARDVDGLIGLAVCGALFGDDVYGC